VKAKQTISIFYDGKRGGTEEIPIAWLRAPSQKRVEHGYGDEEQGIAFCDTLTERNQITLDYTPYISESKKFNFYLGKLTMEFFFVDDDVQNGDVKITSSIWQDQEGQEYPVTTDTDFDSTPEHAEALENNQRLVTHMKRERDPRLKKSKIESARRANKLYCELCALGEKSKYQFDGFLFEDILEVHHNKPLSERQGPTITTLEDLVILCPNCHRTIHRSKDGKGQILSVKEFKALYPQS
jgi:predicted HNH restriction endonuclease